MTRQIETFGTTGPAGANGTNGTNGNTVITGHGAPSSGTGVNGDSYIDLDALTLYSPKAAGVWPSGVFITGPQRLLAVKSYDPAALADYSTTSATAVDIDTTNLAVTFMVPSSGSVFIKLSAAAAVTAGWGAWALRSGGAMIAKTFHVVARTSNGQRFTTNYFLSGLTAGASMTINWAHACPNGGGTMHTYAGGSDGVVFYGGQALMEVYDATMGDVSSTTLNPTPVGRVLGMTTVGSVAGVQNNVSTTSSTLSLVNASLTVTFAAPASGSVLFELSAFAIEAAGTLGWGLLDSGSTPVANTKTIVESGNGSNPRRYTIPIPLTGLTAGTSYTFQWGHANFDNSSTVFTEYSGNQGPAVMKVLAA